MAPRPPSSPPGGEEARRRSRRLQKRTVSPAIDYPERLRDDDHDAPDAPDPHKGPPMPVNMNQSIFGLIAAAGSRVNFNDRFDGSSSSSDSDADEEEDLSKTTILQPKKTKSHRKSAKQKLLRSLPALPKRFTKRRVSQEQSGSYDGPDDDEDSPEPEPPSIQLSRELTGSGSIMGRMLEAQAESESRPSFDMARSMDRDMDTPTRLAERLQKIFELDEPENVIEEYPCWLLQSVLLQGFMYITTRHICFYAYLPKRANRVAKTGYLSKSGKRNPKYNRYWFSLQGDVLSYYLKPTDTYFPYGQIDLSFGISAALNDRDKDGLGFKVITANRTYHFRADSAPSAKEWVKSLQRVIFRSHNDGDSVKISLPIDNVIDVEEMKEVQMMKFADTCKIRVIDNDETYAIDEYFFSFFHSGEKVIQLLKVMVEDASSGIRTVDNVLGTPGPSQSLDVSQKSSHYAKESVRATLAPMSPGSPRASGENSSRSSFDGFRRPRKSLDVSGPMEAPRRSFSASRMSASRSRSRVDDQAPMQSSSDSPLQSSIEDPSYSNIAASSEDPSASQILRGSEVFRGPTVRRPHEDVPESPKTTRPSRPRVITAESSAERDSEAYSSQRQPSPSLQNIVQMGTYPLQRANAFAEYLNKTGKRMSTLLATESMGYVEKVSGMWKGGRKHYDEPHGLRTDDDDFEEDSEGKIQISMDRFRAHFALPKSERLQATYFGYIFRVLPLYGKVYISDRFFCFRSLLPGTRTKLILPLKDIENVQKEKGFRFGYSGLVVVIRGHEELFFEFGQAGVRDDCAVKLHQSLDATRYLKEHGLDNELGREEEEEEEAMAERDALRDARQEEFPEHELSLPHQAECIDKAPTILLDDAETSFLTFKPQEPMRITCLTIGSRGDVQPYIALCKGLINEGHKPRIATHAEFQGWIESHGIEFAPVDGDPGELMRLCIENGTFTFSFLREANSTFRGWLDSLLDSAYSACEGSDLLIESPSAMAGIHIAEKLGIPYFRAFTMPWTRTRAYPHAFIMPEHKMGGAYNYMTYIMFDNIFWKATAHQINRWRNNTLGLPNTSLEKMQPNKVPFLYNFSPSVVAPPLDFSDWIRVTGYWFLDEGGRYDPPQDLADFIAKARADDKKLVYVGFGSIIVNDPAKMTQEVIDAVLRADVRCILSKGWSDRISPKDDPARPKPEEPEMPPEIFVIKSAPHDWLFKQIDAAAHHGGSGTTGASLRAGIPTIIRPFFGDQFFFASRVEDLGVGVWVKKWGTNSFGRALWEVTRNERMIVKAKVLGEQIRTERGVDNAIQSLYRDLEYAKSLVKRKGKATARPKAEDGQEGAEEHTEDEEAEESWTFVGADEPDPEQVTRKLSDMAGLSLDKAASGTGSGKALGSQVLR